MTNNLRIVLLAFALIFIYNFCDSSVYEVGLLGSVGVIGFCFWIIRKNPVPVSTPFSTTMNGLQRTYYEAALSSEKNRRNVQLAIFLVLTVYWMRELIGRLAFFFFSFFDNAFRFADNVTPLLSWAVLGLISGASAGAVYFANRYRLSATFKCLPVAFFILVISILAIINTPFEARQFQVASPERLDTVTIPKVVVPKIVGKKAVRKRKLLTATHKNVFGISVTDQVNNSAQDSAIQIDTVNSN